MILISRTCGKCLRVLDTGIVEFTGNPVQEPEAACRLEVLASGGPNPRAIKLRSMLYPHFLFGHCQWILCWICKWHTDTPTYNVHICTYATSRAITHALTNTHAHMPVFTLAFGSISQTHTHTYTHTCAWENVHTHTHTHTHTGSRRS